MEEVSSGQNGYWDLSMRNRCLIFWAMLLLPQVMIPGTAAAGSVHVGHKSVAGGIKSWGAMGSHQNFYERMMAKYNSNPVAFTNRHHLMSKAIRNPTFHDAMVNRFLSHPDRFIHYHPCFSRFLDGELAARQQQTPTPEPPAPTPSVKPIVSETITSGGNIQPGPLPDPQPLSVPEPSSLAMLGVATILGGGYVARHRLGAGMKSRAVESV